MTEEQKKKLGIKSTKNASEHGLKVLCFGAAGTGKTTMAGTLPGSTLILNVENGALVLKDKDIDIIDIKKVSSEDPDEMTLLRAYQLIKDGTIKYDNVVLDSLTEISETLFTSLDTTMTKDEKDFGGLYVAFRSQMVQIIKAFRDLSNVNVIFIALEDMLDINGFQKMFPSTPHKKTSMNLAALFDEVLHIEVDANGIRSLRTTDSSQCVAKTRTGIEDGTKVLDFSKLYSTLTKGK